MKENEKCGIVRISLTLCDDVFKLIRYLRDMLLMVISTNPMCAYKSNCSKHIALYDTFKYGDPMVHRIMVKYLHMWHAQNRHEEYKDTNIMISDKLFKIYKQKCPVLGISTLRPSDHGADEVYQVSFQLIKLWLRYSL